ncbi:MAG: hypothetical protein LBN39_05280 [Planctomycetaceae bacterium]|jgi:hypothetical protein|nr:hypothetical protein [Planctomycetaceae bacterium]
MSFFQPLITSAFASYTVRKPSYIEQRPAVEPKNAAGESARVDSAKDGGKPRSQSGDVLDLSSDYQNTYGNSNVKETEKYPEPLKSSSELTLEEEQQVQELKARDTEVRVHEQAHLSAAGPYATGGPTFTYQTGPDGKRYAIGGEVQVDTSEINGDPEATIQKMQTVSSAALAPAEPSGQDQKVAAAARQKETQARMELAQQRSEELKGAGNSEKSEEADKSQGQKFSGNHSAAAYRLQSKNFSAAATFSAVV